ncbi:MAG: YjbQ family protein [Actinobacteria bacterium]|nr:YjbQ family protein [Actinomycetota bacterium]
MESFTIRTSSRTDFKDITNNIASLIANAGVTKGACMVYVPHTTAGVTINENADPAVMRDMETILDRLIPWTGSYRHSEGNSAAHAKSTLVGHSVTVPVQGGKLALGTWQGIYFCEFDGPRNREILIQIL